MTYHTTWPTMKQAQDAPAAVQLKFSLQLTTAGRFEGTSRLRRWAEPLRGFMLLGNNIFQAQGYKRLTLDFLGGRLYAER